MSGYRRTTRNNNMVVKPKVYVSNDDTTLPIKLVAQPITIHPNTSIESADVQYTIEPEVYVTPFNVQPVLVDDEDDDDYDDDEIELIDEGELIVNNRAIRNNKSLRSRLVGNRNRSSCNRSTSKKYMIVNNSSNTKSNKSTGRTVIQGTDGKRYILKSSVNGKKK